jgi:predicted kinase
MDVHILMGASGAGKTRWADLMLPFAERCSVNNYFKGEDGLYRFDSTKLELAHNQCLRQFMTAVQCDADSIVVDNTNHALWEMAPYIAVARAYEANILLHAFVSRPLDDCIKHSRHDVPEVSIRGQFRQVRATLEGGLCMDYGDIRGFRGCTVARKFRPFQLTVMVH